MRLERCKRICSNRPALATDVLMPDRIILPEGCQHFPTGVCILHKLQGEFNSSMGGVAGAARGLCPPQARRQMLRAMVQFGTDLAKGSSTHPCHSAAHFSFPISASPVFSPRRPSGQMVCHPRRQAIRPSSLSPLPGRLVDAELADYRRGAAGASHRGMAAQPKQRMLIHSDQALPFTSMDWPTMGPPGRIDESAPPAKSRV